MKQTASIMGMPITVEISNIKNQKSKLAIEKVFDYFKYVDEKYSPFKETSEVGKLNRGEEVSDEMKEILRQAQDLKDSTNGYFDIKKPDGKIDPSGIVKGWAIKNAADILRKAGFKKFFVDAGGDAEIVGKKWKWGIRNPFYKEEIVSKAWHSDSLKTTHQIVKVLKLSNCGIATSGTYERGQHIYNPITKSTEITDIVSLTVIGKNVYEADKMATPGFAMGRAGIEFIESQPELEGYMIDKDGIAIMTSGFSKYEIRR